MKALIRQVSGYVGASALGFVTDFAVLYLLVSQFYVPYLMAAAVSFLAGTIVVYWVSIRHVFDYRRIDDWRHEFGIFATLGLLGLAVNLFAMHVLVEVFGVHYLLAKVGAAGFTFSVNFLSRRWMLFHPRKAVRPRAERSGAPR